LVDAAFSQRAATYDEALAASAWNRTVDFLKNHLR
jgi:dienelactone hydrolase